MAQKSVIVGLPVVPFNQNKVADVCQYLQWLEDFFFKVFQTEVRAINFHKLVNSNILMPSWKKYMFD